MALGMMVACFHVRVGFSKFCGFAVVGGWLEDNRALGRPELVIK
jgi:hypothetical protein